MRSIFILFITFAAIIHVLAQGSTTDTTSYLAGDNWDRASMWRFSSQEGASTGSISDYAGLNDDGLQLAYSFPGEGGWINTELDLASFGPDHPVVLFVYATSDLHDLELKFIDEDGSVFGLKIPLAGFMGEWKHLCLYQDDTEYWWGGDASFDTPARFSIAVSGGQAGSASVFIDEAGIGKTGLPSTIASTIDPNWALPGTGFLQRRDAAINPEDPLVLAYLEAMQDHSSVAGNLLATYQGGTEAQTFNNALAALAFLVKDEKERAERILDAYQSATDSLNSDIRKQNFFYNGEARGFYQQFVMASGLDESNSDRWVGDMAWLLIACKNYEVKYASHRYDYLVALIRDLLLSFYTDAETGGYIQSGWRDGDSYLHESMGHHEGNIDCYVALKLCGEEYYAHKIKLWLDEELAGRTTLPLDLYTWRCLAFGAIDEAYVSLLNIPEYDFRFRKVMDVKGEDVMGFYSSPDISVNNFWNDGTGHISCAFQAFGDEQRGYFYANQMDPLIIPQVFGTETVHGIPYTLNTEGYPGVDPSVAVISCAAWYIMAKNGCNPFLSGEFTDIDASGIEKIRSGKNAEISRISPNPFSQTARVDFQVRQSSWISIDIFNLEGVKVHTLEHRYFQPGEHSVAWNGETSPGTRAVPGMYLLKLTGDGISHTKSIIFLP